MDQCGNVQDQDLVLPPSAYMFAVSATSLLLLLLLVLVVFVVVILAYCLWKSWESARARKFPGNRAGASSLPSPIAVLPRWLGLLGGHTLQIHPEKMVDQMENWADELGGTYELTMFGKRTVVATEVADVRQVLNLRPSLFKRGLSANHFRWPAGQIGLLPSIFFDEDEEWRRSRRLICPSLRTRDVAVMIPSIAHILKRLCTQLGERAEAGEVVDAILVFERFTHDCIALAAFGLDADSLRAIQGTPCPSFDCMDTILRSFMALVLQPLSMIGWVALPGLLPWVRHTKQSSKQLEGVVQGAIDAARLQNNLDNNFKNNLEDNAGSRQINGEVDGVREPSGGDLLRQMVATSDGGTGRLGNRMTFSDKFITRQVMSLFLGGTVASAFILSWAMYFLTKNPNMFARCREEALRAAPDSAGVVSTDEELSKLVFCKALIMETLRLRSGSVVLFFHNAKATSLESGTVLEKDTGVIVLTRYACLSDELFTRAAEFVPERWIEEERDEALLGSMGAGSANSDSNHTARHDKGALLSFGGGPRVCPGKEVAKAESAMTVAAICAQFDVALAPGQADPPEEILTYVSGPRAVKLVLKKRVRSINTLVVRWSYWKALASQRELPERSRSREPMPDHEDAGMERIELLKTEVAALKFESEIGRAEAALQASYAEDPASTRFWSWQEPMMAEKLQFLREEHELQTEVLMNVDEVF